MRSPGVEYPTEVLAMRVAGAHVAARRLPGMESGRRYGPAAQTTWQIVSGGQSVGSGTILYTPIWVPARTTFTQIGAQVEAVKASQTFRLGLYEDDGAGRPSSLIFGSGLLDGATTGIKTASISITLDAGWYWLAIRASNSAVKFRALDANYCAPLLGFPDTASNIGACHTMWTEPGAYAAMPATASPSSTSSANLPIIFLEV